MRTHAEWNVLTHIRRARRPTRAATRSFISPAALLVNVIARISPGWTSRAASRYAIRLVSTRVLPEPAPATINNGVPKWVTAARWASLSPSRRRAGSAPAGSGRLAGVTGTGGTSKRACIARRVYAAGPTEGRSDKLARVGQGTTRTYGRKS